VRVPSPEVRDGGSQRRTLMVTFFGMSIRPVKSVYMVSVTAGRSVVTRSAEKEPLGSGGQTPPPSSSTSGWSQARPVSVAHCSK
jgi:hypothetical protein